MLLSLGGRLLGLGLLCLLFFSSAIFLLLFVSVLVGGFAVIVHPIAVLLVIGFGALGLVHGKNRQVGLRVTVLFLGALCGILRTRGRIRGGARCSGQLHRRLHQRLYD